MIKWLLTPLVVLSILITSTAYSAVLVFSPNGQYVAKTTLAAAASAADTVGKTIVVTSPQTLASNVTIPSTVNLKIEKGGVITTTGYTLTINSPFSPGTYQVFTGSGAVTGLKEARPEWWGGGDDTIQSAVNAAPLVRLSSSSYAASNVKLPATGITVVGDNPYTTIINNTSASNSTFYTDSTNSVNQWVFIKDLTINMSNASASGDAIKLYNVENALVENVKITTPPAQATTGNGIYAERTSSGSNGYYITVRKCFIEKQGRGIYLKGGSGYRMNVHTVEDSVINNNTLHGILFEETTTARVIRSSLELNADNIEILNSSGAIVSDNYFERPDTHNVILDTSSACKIKNNHISSAGYVSTSTGRGVLVKSGSQFNQIYDNSIIDGWSAYDIEVQAGALQTIIRDNVARDRVAGWGASGTQILDNGTQTIKSNPYLTAGGNVFWDWSAQNFRITNFTTPTGTPVKIGETTAGIYAGANTPEGAVTAYRGSIYLRTNAGSPNISFYVKESGDNTNTGWVAK